MGSSVRDAVFLDVQGFLDEVCDTMLRRDFAAHRDLFDLPYVVTMAAGTRVVTERSDLSRLLEIFLKGYDTFGFEGLRYELIRADALGPDLVSVLYETHYWGGRKVDPAPYRAIATIRRCAERWRAVSNVQAIGHADWVTRLMSDDAMRQK